MFSFYTFLADISSFINIDCNFFVIRLKMLISFSNDVDIQLILKSKNSFGKYHPVFPIKHFFGTPCTFYTKYNDAIKPSFNEKYILLHFTRLLDKVDFNR